ncbi:hypothetical protein [Candidatus Foliamicus sp.]
MTENIQNQIGELTAIHRGLSKAAGRNGETALSGALPFAASADGLETITDSFDVELAIPNDLPDTLPCVRETGGRIGTDYEHRNPDGTLCLAVPVAQRCVFLEEPSLLGFVNRLVIPYLYDFCFFEKYGHHPFGEAAHGDEGILSHYLDALDLDGDLDALRVICFLFEHGYRGHHDCPCGSGRRVRACHGPALLTLHKAHNEQSLRTDFMAILKACVANSENGRLSLPTPLHRQIRRLLKKFRDY